MRTAAAQAMQSDCLRFAISQQQAGPIVPASAPRRGVQCDPSTTQGTQAMPKIESPEHDPNAELRSFEPLRVTLALGALLLGLILGMH
jgi:hypothetical protein